MGNDTFIKSKANITLGGVDYEAAFPMRAAYLLASKHGGVANVLKGFLDIANGNYTADAFEKLSDFVSASVVLKYPEMTAEHIMDYELEEVVEACTLLAPLFRKAMGYSQTTEDGDPQKA